jgi:carboxymethylenebutenolidase
LAASLTDEVSFQAEKVIMRNLMRCLSAVVVLALLASPALAQVKASEIKIKSGDEQIVGYLAVPEGKGPFPAVVVIQEWWGLADWIKENTKRIAGKGYVALAPDLYRGKVTDDMKVAAQLRKGLPNDRALRDLNGAVAALTAMGNVKKDKVGSIGWCMGGNYSLQLALDNSKVGACVICYGAVYSDVDKLKSLHAKVLGVFGEDDKGIPAKGVRAFEDALKTAGKSVEKINIYKGAGHGFMRPMNGAKPNPEYRETQARDAWRQIDAFFEKTLTK